MTLEAGKGPTLETAAKLTARLRHVLLRRPRPCRRACCNGRQRDRVGPRCRSSDSTEQGVDGGFVGKERSSPFPLARLSVFDAQDLTLEPLTLQQRPFLPPAPSARAARRQRSSSHPLTFTIALYPGASC